MAGATEFYGLAYFDFGDELDTPLNISREVERFTIIDRQLYGMFNVFGDGVINGWNVTDGTGTGSVITLNISSGVGIIDLWAVESDFNDAVQNIPPNTTGYVYAIINSDTVVDREVAFVYSLTPLVTSSLVLAEVVTGPSAVISIDTTVRTLIGFKQIISQVIATTRNNGIDAPKIDLTQEVQGELPMDNLADLDASKIGGSAGKLPVNVLPPIDHTTLTNVGTLTHAQLDTFVQSIQKDNIALFGEVTSVNLLKMFCYMKYLDSSVDKYAENQLVIIPGITPDSYIDWTVTNANVDELSHCISGLPSIADTLGTSGSQNGTTGVDSNLQIVTVPWVTDADFNLATSMSNITISNGVKIGINATAARVIDSFDTGIIGQPITTYVGTLNETNSTVATYDQPAAQGPLAGTFTTTNSRSMQYVRTFPRSQDWTSYDTINIYVKSGLASHAAVTMVVKDDTGAELSTYLLLGTNEVTTLNNATTNGFALKQFSIAGFTRNSVGSITFITDAITNVSESFSIDTIYLTTQTYLMPQGEIKLRYNTTSAVIFNDIEYYGDFPSGTDFRVRVRVANTLEDLANATYSSVLSSGEVFALPGSYIEIDIILVSDATHTKTPTLQSLYLSLLVPAQEAGLTITSASDWEQGVSENISISDQGVITMTRTNVGDFYFLNGIYVNELDPTELPVSGVTAENMPVAPYQGYAAINAAAQVPDPLNPGREFLRGLYNPRSVYRLETGDFLIADTGNDRIIEMTQDGLFVRGFASHNQILDTLLYALTANYNPRIGVLFITWSMQLDIKYIDLTKIILNVGGRDIQLSNAVDQVRDPTTGAVIDRPDLTAFLDGSSGNYQGKVDNLVSIILSADKQTLLANQTTSLVSVRVLGNPSPATNAQVLNAPTGIECFIGDYMYFGRGGIWNPIYANETEEDRYILCNATVNHNSNYLAPSGVGSVIEFEKAIGSPENGTTLGTTFSYTTTIFSDIMLGCVDYFTVTDDTGEIERKVLIAGMVAGQGYQASSSSAAPTTNSTSGQIYLGATDPIKLSNYVGQVSIVDMDSQLTSFQYTSPDGLFPSDAYFDDDGNIVVAESGILAYSGRIVTLDPSGTVIKLIQGGMYTSIWDIRKLPNGHIFVST